MKFKITLLKPIMLDIDIDRLKKTLYNNDIDYDSITYDGYMITIFTNVIPMIIFNLIKEKDNDWEVVKSIPHKNKTSNILKKNVRLFWNEHKTDESLFNPYLYESLQLAISQKQKEVDYIRKHNKRYIKL